MTHDELLAELTDTEPVYARATLYSVLRAVVELHKPQEGWNDLEVCNECSDDQYVWLPCPTIQAIEENLK